MSNANYGDLICSDHGLYKHFGIYINEDCVIHYDGKIDDKFLRKMCIRKTTMDRFLAGNESFKVCKFKNNFTEPFEVVKRANSRIGEQNFNIIFNNCEHFGHWCQTGVSKSNQVDFIVLIIIFIILLNYSLYL